jgi:D-arabinose 1-dehydrogenase-like Zn-dependent alcohol dehydrogenase
MVDKSAGTMLAARVPKAGGDFQLVECAIPEPNAGEVRIKVQACGVCHSDIFTKEGMWPGIVYPRVPGHEVAGVIDAIGSGVSVWQKGQRVDVGWHGGQDNTCPVLSEWRFSQLPKSESSRDQLRWRIRPIYDRAYRGTGVDARWADRC